MPQFINTNVASLNAQRNLNSSQNAQNVALQRLSSGLRINSASDDAAGLAVSQKMMAQVKSINQAVRNANDGISMIQTAEGGMQETQTMLQRMRELSTQASSDTISDTERGYINNELQQLKTEVNAIADRTKFNGQSLLTGSLKTSLGGATGTDIVVGDQVNTTGGNSAVTAVDVSGAQAGKTYTLTGSTSAGTLTLTRSGDSVAQTISVSALGANAAGTLDFSSLGVKLTLQADSGGKTQAGIITDLTAAANDTIVTASGSGSATLQIGADSGSGNTLSVSFENVKIDTTANGAASAMDALNTALSTFNGASTRANASSLLTAVDSAIDYVSSKRATLGAVMNRLGNTISNLQVTSENISAARSRIVDADFAAETAELTRAQILQQAGTAMLAQANSTPQNVLSLLRG